jgi:hypothetical protein
MPLARCASSKAGLWLVNSFPLPACRFARAPSCRRLTGVTSFGFDHTIGAVFYALRIHLRAADCGVVAKLEIAPANAHDFDAAPEMHAPTGLHLSDRNDWSRSLQHELRGRRNHLTHIPFLSNFACFSRSP